MGTHAYKHREYSFEIVKPQKYERLHSNSSHEFNSKHFKIAFEIIIC